MHYQWRQIAMIGNNTEGLGDQEFKLYIFTQHDLKKLANNLSLIIYDVAKIMVVNCNRLGGDDYTTSGATSTRLDDWKPYVAP